MLINYLEKLKNKQTKITLISVTMRKKCSPINNSLMPSNLLQKEWQTCS